MRSFYENLQIDNKCVLVPDEDMKMEYIAIVSQDAGRDESGYMHPIILRDKVCKWTLEYAELNAEEYRYMESLFDGKQTFWVDYLDIDGRTKRMLAYRTEHILTLHNAKAGVYKNYRFSILQC